MTLIFWSFTTVYQIFVFHWRVEMHVQLYSPILNSAHNCPFDLRVYQTGIYASFLFFTLRTLNTITYTAGIFPHPLVLNRFNFIDRVVFLSHLSTCLKLTYSTLDTVTLFSPFPAAALSAAAVLLSASSYFSNIIVLISFLKSASLLPVDLSMSVIHRMLPTSPIYCCCWCL